MTALRIAAPQLAELRQDLLSLSPAGGAAFLLAEPCGDDFVVRRFRVFHPDELDDHDSALSIREDVQARELAEVKRSGHALIDVHTHPHSDREVHFSSFDRTQLPAFAHYIQNKMPGRAYGAIVLGRRGYKGLVWSAGGAHPLDLVGVGEICAQPEWAVDDAIATTIEPRYDRQVRAVGTQGQVRLKQLRVGVVGLGGTGSLIIQQLAHSGVPDFTLIDDDRVDRTNLPRLAGATWRDAVLRTKKGRVAARQIRRVGTRATVRQYGGLRSLEAMTALSKVDVIVGCVDNDGARLVLSELAAAYLVPYLDIGVSIVTSKNRPAMGGRVSFALPSQACLACADEIDFAEAGEDLESEALRNIRVQRGYADDRTVEPALMPLNTTCAGLATLELLAFATGFRKVRPFMHFNALDNRIVPIRVERNPHCPVCVPALGMGDRQGIERYAV